MFEKVLYYLNAIPIYSLTGEPPVLTSNDTAHERVLTQMKEEIAVRQSNLYKSAGKYIKLTKDAVVVVRFHGLDSAFILSPAEYKRLKGLEAE